MLPLLLLAVLAAVSVNVNVNALPLDSLRRRNDTTSLARRWNPSVPSQFPQSGSGDGTYYNGNGGYGSCGILIIDTLPQIAFPHDLVDETKAAWNPINPNDDTICGQCVEITGPAGTSKAWILDRCEGCVTGDVDMVPSVYAATVKDFAIVS
ncbi:hypothetical protein HK101_004307 [Irineochytrium annulatum]|nr:hypothetical protein HK101_004307 [Irineochytrium annulatum]